jgi:hypothetical protein
LYRMEMDLEAREFDDFELEERDFDFEIDELD